MAASKASVCLWGNKKDILNKVSSLYQVGVFMEYREAETVKDRVTEQLAKLDEKLKKLTRMRLEDEITRESYFEFKSEIEKEKLDLLSKRRVLDTGMVPNGNPEDPAKKWKIFCWQKWILPTIVSTETQSVSSSARLFPLRKRASTGI